MDGSRFHDSKIKLPGRVLRACLVFCRRASFTARAGCRAHGSAESTKFPAPPPPAKPEPPTLPPDEIIRRFAAKEDEMARAIRGYTFQKDVRIQEIGQSNRAAGQLDVVTQLRDHSGRPLVRKAGQPPALDAALPGPAKREIAIWLPRRRCFRSPPRCCPSTKSPTAGSSRSTS